MNGYFIAIIILLALDLGWVAAKNGNPKELEYSFVATLLTYAIFVALSWFAINS